MHDQLSQLSRANADLVIDGDPEVQLKDEACALLEQAQSPYRQHRWQASVLTGDLLDRARRALDRAELTPGTFARVLRSCVLIRDFANVPELPPEALLDELVNHTTEHGLASHNAAAQAMRGLLATAHHNVDEALDAAVNAMVTVELVNEAGIERAFATNDTGVLLWHLGLVDLAAEQFAAASAACAAIGLIKESLTTASDGVLSELANALSLERVGRNSEAEQQFAIAAEHARETLTTWRQADPPIQLRSDHTASLYAALELVESAGEHEADLREALTASDPDSSAIAGIALARRLLAAGSHDEARCLLVQLEDAPRAEDRQPQIRFALANAMANAEGFRSNAYVATLERELWARREDLARSLRARLEHERLRRRHGPIRTLAAEDPLTGLPNRLALDELLVQLAADDRPSAVAMVDLDKLREINERGSHADGDATLRAVAVAIRGSLAGTDSVVRYGGDEFVLLMPNSELSTANCKTHKVVAEIAALPPNRGFGVTASAGLVAVAPDENPESILVRADNAMGAAKQRGGNQVCRG